MLPIVLSMARRILKPIFLQDTGKTPLLIQVIEALDNDLSILDVNSMDFGFRIPVRNGSN
jgi:hypothetical protein